MGTSSSYDGQKDHKKLIPDDYNEEENSEEENSEEENSEEENRGITWQGAKTQFSKYINNNHGAGVRKTASNYVKAAGGRKNLLKKSKSGISVAVRFANTLLSMKEKGLYKTFEELGIEYKGKSMEEICSLLVNSIAEEGITKDEIIGREAITDAISEMYEYIEKNNLDFELTNSVPENLMDQVLCKFIGSYIWGKILNNLEICLEKNCSETKRSKNIEQDMKDYVVATVSAAFEFKGMREKIFGRNSMSQAIETLYDDCYKTLEKFV